MRLTNHKRKTCELLFNIRNCGRGKLSLLRKSHQGILYDYQKL